MLTIKFIKIYIDIEPHKWATMDGQILTAADSPENISTLHFEGLIYEETTLEKQVQKHYEKYHIPMD